MSSASPFGSDVRSHFVAGVSGWVTGAVVGAVVGRVVGPVVAGCVAGAGVGAGGPAATTSLRRSRAITVFAAAGWVDGCVAEGCVVADAVSFVMEIRLTASG